MVSFVNLRVLCGLRFGDAIVDDLVRTLTAKKVLWKMLKMRNIAACPTRALP